MHSAYQMPIGRRYSSGALGVAVLLVLLAVLGSISRVQQTNGILPSDRFNFDKLPLSFEPNMGQSDPSVRFMAHASGGTMYFTPSEVVLSLQSPQEKAMERTSTSNERSTPVEDAPAPSVLRLQFLGANPDATMEGREQLLGKVNYFIGNDPSKWHTDLPTYSTTHYENLYPGIDLKYEGTGGQLKGTFTVAPGADLSLIQWRYEGAQSVHIDETGNIQVALSGDRGISVAEQAPVAWQEIGGEQVGVKVLYNLAPDNRASFVPASYNHNHPLIIDPTLTYSTYLGGSSSDHGYGIAVDTSGNAYVTGFTLSTNFPLQNPFQPTSGGTFDAFVTKFSATGSTLIYSTYLGGGSDEYGNGIAVDTSGNAYVTGRTFSTNFPLQNPFQPTLGGTWDVFVTKFSATGSTLLYSTYLGGSSYDWGTGIAVGTSGNAYVTGLTSSTNFPLQNPYQPTFGGGTQDVFVTKFSATGSALVYSTYLGGSSGDEGWGIDVDTSGNAYVTGYTTSPNFPLQNPFQPTFVGGTDVFVTKFSATGSTLIYSTYLGGSNGETGEGIAVDASGNAYVTGYTQSTNFPLQNPFQPTFGGSSDAFVTKFSATGSTLIYSTYLGGSASDYGLGIAVDTSGNAYVTGWTTSTNFPLQNPFQPTNGGTYDAFVTKFSATGSTLLYSTYLGGNNWDEGYGIAVDTSGNAYVTGFTLSTNFPLQNPFQPTSGGTFDAFVTKLSTQHLDLPFSYDGTESTFRRYVGNWNQGGKISSWFDHDLPTYGRNNNVHIWTGDIFNRALTNPDVGCWDGYCYDGHNGIDFAPTYPSTVRSAAAGTVVRVSNNCAAQSWGCGGGYGNYVIVYHGQIGDFTLYGHLGPNSIQVTEGVPVTAGSALGMMGNTGSSRGAHIHFGVYRDNGNGQWNNDPNYPDSGPERAVDPFGWFGSSRSPSVPDPWAANPNGAPSSILWRYSPKLEQIVPRDQQVTIQDPASGSSVLIAANTFLEDVGLYLLPGQVHPPADPLRTVQHDLTLDMHGGESLADDFSTVPMTLSQPITLTITYTDSELIGLDPQQLSIYSYDGTQQQWEPLTSTVVYTAHQVIAYPDHLGEFSLMAPLLCSTDLQEPNDSYVAARYIVANSSPITGSLQTLMDQDWFSFQAEITRTYQLTTSNLAPDVVTVLNLYDTSGLNLLASSTSGGGQGSEISWTPAYSGTYFLQTYSATTGAVGCQSSYQLGISAAVFTNTPTPVPTNTSTVTRTSTRTSTATRTSTSTNTPTPLPTQTPGGPTATPVPTNTNTSTPSRTPTHTSTPTRTNTPTHTATFTNTPSPTTTPTSLPTQTPGGPTATPIPTNTAVLTMEPSYTPVLATPTTVVATATPTTCTIQFTDVPEGSTFYSFVRCLACRNILSGYADGTFRPGNNVTRGQLSKIVANAAGFTEPPSTQSFEDVPASHTFYDFIERMATRGIIGGYSCGGPGEPCLSGKPYFRPGNNATRGQIAKIVSNAAGFSDPPGNPMFEDVPQSNTFFEWVNRLASRGIIGGYNCGGPGEPCGQGSLPYFRPGNNATRGQISKIVANTFFPNCQTP